MIVQALSIIAMLAGLGGNLLMAKKNILVYPVWILSNILWIIVGFLTYVNVSQMLMYSVYTIMQIYGWREWKKK